jgi:Putative phage serine protease XkdF
MDDSFSINVDFAKAARSDDRRLVGGYAYVSKVGGQLLHDTQGDSIEPEDLREAVHEFMKSGRTMGVMHIPGPDGKPIAGGEIVEMAVLAGDFRPPHMSPDVDALWVVAKVHDDMVWTMIKDGSLSAFSIGGKGQRTPV